MILTFCLWPFLSIILFVLFLVSKVRIKKRGFKFGDFFSLNFPLIIIVIFYLFRKTLETSLYGWTNFE